MNGILVSTDLRALCDGGGIGAVQPVHDDQLQPSSIDLRIGARIWQLQCSFLPGPQGMDAKRRRLSTTELRTDIDQPVVLHHGGVYLAEIEESLRLPSDIRGLCNPKSSTGRLDVFVRILTDKGEAFDTIPAGYCGRLFAEITPQSFHVRIRRGDRLSQLRLVRGNADVPTEALRARQKSHDAPVVDENGQGIPLPSDCEDGILLSVDLIGNGGPVGFLARRHQPPVDLAQQGLPITQYWTPLSPAPQDGHVLEPEQFYIFATRERLRIPPEWCAELVPFDATRGELRTHYAGFIDSGFGWSPTGGPGAQLVLEVRTHDVPFLLEHGQRLFRLRIAKNCATPDVLYGDGRTSSHYQHQGLRLARQFGDGCGGVQSAAVPNEND